MAVCVVGDVVGSREVADQRSLLDGVAVAVRRMAGARSAAPTTGDEFQALFDDLPTAVRSVADLRLRLLEESPVGRPVVVRAGFGVGEVIGPEPADAGAPGQSGSGWWHARAALDHVTASRRAWPSLRWWVEGDDPAVGATAALLVTLDTLLARFDGLDVSLARGLLAGETARSLAAVHGLAPQSVGQRLHDHGVYGWVRALQTLTQEPA